MAFKGKIIKNEVTGQSIRFVTTAKDSKGKLLEMVTTYLPRSTPPAPHYHPVQHEEFSVLEGELTIKLDDKTIVLLKGQSIDIPKNCNHSMWNASAVKTIVSWKVTPALNTEYFLEIATGLANDGKVNTAGRPGLLQVALLANKHRSEFRLSKPSFLLQRIVFSILSPLALLSGKKASYKQYIN
ncbi:cupin domain-containing protein [Pinibacter soli]|uniref:Cupin domain-containing protein n=1 Tax=Pinibacter soli TaxID=3044211 RepID=A0ABT6RII6_9BACT|nr:cupin domain-containing protein [Pinibacter soli]MDI3322375.1 cupin domain-containing protein [Pinibacter soli]